MDLNKIGKFIAKSRKERELTQEQLATKLGVSNKTISRWENGNYMPDISILKPLSEELEITLNELLSGEKVAKETVQQKSEENIINTIEYSEKKINTAHKKVSVALIVLGLVMCISALTVFEPESSWSSLYSIIGIILFTVGIVKEIKINKIYKVCVGILIFICTFSFLYVIDYISVVNNNKAPIYTFKTETTDKIVYHTLFYNVYRINPNTVNEYYIVDNKKEYTKDNVPVSPFNITKSGIENIKKYRNKYIGNNSNIGNLISNLPISEYGYVFQIDSQNLGLTINYNTTDWYKNDNKYIEKALIYNSISIFYLIDNVEYIVYNFSGSSYKITRDNVENNYFNYNKLNENEDSFKVYVENKINEIGFVEENFNKLFAK